MILKQIDLELPQALHLFTSFIKLGWQFLQAGVYFTMYKYLVLVNSLNEKIMLVLDVRITTSKFVFRFLNVTNVDARECEYREICNIRFSPNLFLAPFHTRARSKSVES